MLQSRPLFRFNFVFFTRAEKQILIRDMTVCVFGAINSKFIKVVSILYNKVI